MTDEERERRELEATIYRHHMNNMDGSLFPNGYDDLAAGFEIMEQIPDNLRRNLGTPTAESIHDNSES